MYFPSPLEKFHTQASIVSADHSCIASTCIFGGLCCFDWCLLIGGFCFVWCLLIGGFVGCLLGGGMRNFAFAKLHAQFAYYKSPELGLNLSGS